MLAETTIQADVGPGNQTGVYYITICNLPFGTSWQQLKDWTRSACVVDHIEVFQNSTSGWVRIKGKENFDKAWGLLNGGVFNGRSIIASDRNRNHSIKIKELVESSQSPYSQLPHTQYHTAPLVSQFGSVPTTTASSIIPPQYSTVSTGQYWTAGYAQVGGIGYSGHSIPAQSYTYQPAITTSASIPVAHAVAVTEAGDYYNYGGTVGGFEQNAVAYSPHYQYENVSFSLPDRGHPGLSSYYDRYEDSLADSGQGSEYILTEQRKIHVSPFPQQAKADDVRSWIRRKVDKSMIESMDIPQNSNSKYLRGHAFVIFDSASAASVAMDQLNKARFQGRRVMARPTVEGVTADELGYVLMGTSRSGHGDRSRGERSERSRHSKETDKKHLSSESKSSNSTTSSSRKSSQSHSQSHSERKTSSKRASSEKKTGKDAGPVIVDGTSRKRDKR